MVKVSVIIPVYNRETYIADCLKDLCKQTLKEIEIICIDDCSTDKSLQYIRECRKKDKRIKILSMKKNSGSGPARNAGISKAKGEYIAFMDSDDFYPAEDVLEVLYHTAVEKQADVCGGNICSVNAGGRRYFGAGERRNKIKQFQENGYIDIHRFQWCFGYTRYIWNRNFLRENKVSFKNYRRFQDPPFMLQAMLKAKRIYGIHKDVYCARMEHKSVEWDYVKMRDRFMATDEVIGLCRKHGLKDLENYMITDRKTFKQQMTGMIPKIIKNTAYGVYRELHKNQCRLKR